MDLSRLKAEICFVSRRLWQLGWAAANAGNVSALLEDGTVLVTPTGVSKALVSPRMLVRTAPDGSVLEAQEGCAPSSELKMHLRCYRERPDVRAVVHAHPPAATGFACAGVPLDRHFLTEASATIGTVPLAPYALPSTDQVPDSVAPLIRDHDALLLANHGALAVGKDLTAAFFHMETLEHLAKVRLVAQALGGPREFTAEQALCLRALSAAPGARQAAVPPNRPDQSWEE